MASIKSIIDFDGTIIYPKTLSSAVVNSDGTTVSADIETLKNGKAAKDSPAFTGTPTAPTASDGTKTDQIATTKFVQNALSGNYYIGTNKPSKACLWFDTSVSN